jgi:hypothetical protein
MKYHMLKEGDVISDGDEFFYEGRWRETRKESIGFPWEKGLLKYRRPIPEPKCRAKTITVDGHREKVLSDLQEALLLQKAVIKMDRFLGENGGKKGYEFEHEAWQAVRNAALYSCMNEHREQVKPAKMPMPKSCDVCELYGNCLILFLRDKNPRLPNFKENCKRALRKAWAWAGGVKG